jgi:predicted DsbA family dithiol-disulfide isomerase
MPTRPLSITLFSDIVCPWCFIGAAHLKHALELLPDDVEVTLTWQPFLLDPTTPAGGVDLAAHLKRKYGTDPAAMFARVEQAGRAAGVAIDFSRQTHIYPTTAAHTLLRHAQALGTQTQLAHALHTAYFTQGLAIDDPQVLEALATQHGFAPGQATQLADDPQERAITFQLAASASERGIRSVPFFIFDERLAVSGAQPPATLLAAIHKALKG